MTRTSLLDFVSGLDPDPDSISEIQNKVFSSEEEGAPMSTVLVSFVLSSACLPCRCT